jgi:hypothetical protein
MGPEVRERCRSFVILLSARKAADSQRVCDQDYQSVFRCYLCILGRSCSAGRGRLARYRLGEDSECRYKHHGETTINGSTRYIGRGKSHLPMPWTSSTLMIESCKDTRTLLVISNFVNLKRVRIPDMITQLETAFNITVDNDKAVSNTTGRTTHPHPHLHRYLLSTLARQSAVAYLLLPF